jgi:hypothetical protein
MKDQAAVKKMTQPYPSWALPAPSKMFDGSKAGNRSRDCRPEVFRAARQL